MKKVIMTAMVLLSSIPALAEEAVAATAGGNSYGALAAAFAIAIAALGGALGQGKIGAAAMEGIARNPQASKQMFVPLILGLVLIESLVIYALVIALNVAG